MRNILTSGFAAFATLLFIHDHALAQKKPASPNPRIAVTLADGVNDGLRSDGHLAADGSTGYVDCVASPTRCDGAGQIWAGGSEDATFRMDAAGRRFHVTYAEGFSPDGWFLNVRAIGSMPVGSEKVTAAVFSFDGDQGGPQPWASYPNKRFHWNGLHPSLLVHVKRDSPTQWSVTTAPATSSATVGATAVLEQQNQKTSKYSVIGSYDVPFTLTIACLAHCDRLTVR